MQNLCPCTGKGNEWIHGYLGESQLKNPRQMESHTFMFGFIEGAFWILHFLPSCATDLLPFKNKTADLCSKESDGGKEMLENTKCLMWYCVPSLQTNQNGISNKQPSSQNLPTDFLQTNQDKQVVWKPLDWGPV